MEDRSTFSQLSKASDLAGAVRRLQVPLQAELLERGATWEEALGVLRAMGNRKQPFGDPESALEWYRTPRGSH